MLLRILLCTLLFQAQITEAAYQQEKTDLLKNQSSQEKKYDAISQIEFMQKTTQQVNDLIAMTTALGSKSEEAYGALGTANKQREEHQAETTKLLIGRISELEIRVRTLENSLHAQQALCCCNIC